MLVVAMTQAICIGFVGHATRGRQPSRMVASVTRVIVARVYDGLIG
jgi:hypothetical protein